jgi:hypothetical protein
MLKIKRWTASHLREEIQQKEFLYVAGVGATK